MEIKLKELRHWFENTYSIIGNFILGIDHAAVRKSRFAEQMFLPFLPPLFVRLSNEEGRDPLIDLHLYRHLVIARLLGSTRGG